MKRLIASLLLVSGLIASMGSAAHAQTGLKQTTAANPAYVAIVEEVLAADRAELVDAATDTPFTDEELPEGFKAPVDGVPRNPSLVDAFSSGLGDLDGAIGHVTQGIDTDPLAIPGAMTAAIVTYIVVEEAIDADLFDEFEEQLASGLDSPQMAESSIERVDLDGVEVIVANLVMEQGSAVLTMQMVIAPVGNVMVITMLVSVDTEAIDSSELFPFSSSLMIASAMHLGEVAAGI